MKKYSIAIAILLALVFVGFATYGPGNFTTLKAAKTLAVTGATTLSSTLEVTGATTLSSTLDVSSYIAGIDSFSTTALTDTVSLTGAAKTDIFLVSKLNPDYSTAVDSAQYSIQAYTNKFIVTRQNINAGTAKSGAHYSYIRVK